MATDRLSHRLFPQGLSVTDLDFDNGVDGAYGVLSILDPFRCFVDIRFVLFACQYYSTH